MNKMVEAFRNNEFVVSCQTEQEALDFLDICYKKGIKWSNLYSNKTKTEWGDYGDQTCYRGGDNVLSFANIEFYVDKGYKVIKFNDFINGKVPNRSKILELLGLKIGDYFNIEGTPYNPYHFDKNFDLIDCEGDEMNEYIISILWDGIEIKIFPQDRDVSVKNFIDYVQNTESLLNVEKEHLVEFLTEYLDKIA